MPHVVVEGPMQLESLCRSFTPLFERTGDDVVKVRHFYLEKDGEDALVETMVVESGHRQTFFIQLVARGEGLTIRLLPQTDPEKTDGVKRALALVAAFVRDHTPGTARYGRTNIAEFLSDSPAGNEAPE